MRIVWTWILPLLVVAGIVIGISRFSGAVFHRSSETQPEQPQAWAVIPHPPGDRVQPTVPVVKEFGMWHLACVNPPGRPASAPKVGFIQNFGIVSRENPIGQPEQCHVFTMLRDPADPRHTMIVSFRYLTGLQSLEMAIIYTAPIKGHVLVDQAGRVHDYTNKEAKKGIVYADPKYIPPGQKPPQTMPDVGIQLGGSTFALHATGCIVGHCFAHSTTMDAHSLEASRLVVRLPIPRPIDVEVPVTGLGPAVAQLGRMRAN